MLSANDGLPEGATGRTFQLDQKKKKPEWDRAQLFRVFRYDWLN